MSEHRALVEGSTYYTTQSVLEDRMDFSISDDVNDIQGKMSDDAEDDGWNRRWRVGDYWIGMIVTLRMWDCFV